MAFSFGPVTDFRLRQLPILCLLFLASRAHHKVNKCQRLKCHHHLYASQGTIITSVLERARESALACMIGLLLYA
jgi:hypothetical protein